MPGTITKRGNSWRLQVTIGTDFRGKPVRYSKTVHGTKKQAEKELAKFYAECEAGRVNKTEKATVADLARLYLDEYVKKHLKKSNTRAVLPAIEAHIIPDLGVRRASKLTRIDVQQWVNSLEDEKKVKQKNGQIVTRKLSPKTIHNYYSVLSGIMKFGIQMNIIDNNPCRDIMLPKQKRKEAAHYSIGEVARLLEALESVPRQELGYKTAIYIALFGGLRKAEIAGLNWDDVDFESGQLHIGRSRMIQTGEGVYEDTPKTEKSERTITMPEQVMSLLRSLRAQQAEEKLMMGSKWEDAPALLKNHFGGPLYPQSIGRWFSKFIKENELPPLTLHGLRHTHTSLLAYMEMNKVEISKRLGHSQLSTTLNIYTHIFDDSDKHIADALTDFAPFLHQTVKK